MTTTRRPIRMSLKGKLTRPIGLTLGVIVFALPYLVEFEGLSVAGHRIFSVFLLAIVLWVTEAIPLHATAALIILLEILLISDKAALLPARRLRGPGLRHVLAALAHPVLMLFLGGFFLADGAAKFQLDPNLARVLLRPFGDSPQRILLGLMLITALFSMFMSNTATTATLMAVVLPVIAIAEPGGPSADRAGAVHPDRGQHRRASARRSAPRPTPSPSAPWPRPASPSASCSGW